MLSKQRVQALEKPLAVFSEVAARLARYTTRKMSASKNLSIRMESTSTCLESGGSDESCGLLFTASIQLNLLKNNNAKYNPYGKGWK